MRNVRLSQLACVNWLDEGPRSLALRHPASRCARSTRPTRSCGSCWRCNYVKMRWSLLPCAAGTARSFETDYT